MPITLRPDLRQKLKQVIDRSMAAHIRDHQGSADAPPWPGTQPETEQSRPERELMVVPTDPVSMQVLVKSALWYHQGLFGRAWPLASQDESVRTSPAFNPIVLGDYRVDMLYLSYLDVLKIQEGVAQSPYGTYGAVVDDAVVPTQPDRGVPLAYIVLIPGATTIAEDSILDIRPYITTITSQDVDPATWRVFQDFSAQCDGSRTLFAFDLPVAGDRGIVKMNGIVQQPGIAYSISGGSLSLTFAPYANEVLTAEWELGQKDEYSGWGLTPWGTGLWGV